MKLKMLFTLNLENCAQCSCQRCHLLRLLISYARSIAAS